MSLARDILGSIALSVFAAAVVASVVLTLIAIATHDSTERAAAADRAGVLFDGRAAPVHTITDKLQGKTWRAIYVDRGVVIIPGSERPIPVEKP